MRFRVKQPVRRISLVLAVLAAPWWLESVLRADQPQVTELVAAIRGANLDAAAAFATGSVTIDLGFGALEIAEGHIFPATAIAGGVFEAVFVGAASFRIEPPDPIEAHQLELFTHQTSPEVAVQKTVLVFGDPQVLTRLPVRNAAAPPDEPVVADARATYGAWVSGTQRRGFGADAAILKAALGDSAYRGYFAALMHSADLGVFHYVHDPAEQEQVTLGQFVPFEIDDREKYEMERWIRRQQRRGRSLQTRIGDLGDWNTWLQTSRRDPRGAPVPGSAGFEPELYTIDVTLDPKQFAIAGKVAIDAVAESSGRRVVTLELFEDLRPFAVRDGAGRNLGWMRSGSDLHVALAQASEAGSRLRLEIEYRGTIFAEEEPGIFPLRDTYAWYPHLGTYDRARYRATFRYPNRFQLLASGRSVEDRVESGTRIETRALELPGLAFSFEVGAFEIVEEQVGHVHLTIGFSKSTLVPDTKVKPEVVRTLKDALLFYEETFGPYPLDHLSVATVPRGFSQGFLGFLTLSHSLIALPKQAWVVIEGPGAIGRPERRTATIAHELAHQWWGNTVGWASDRDQWLSEALAEYSALLFASKRAESSIAYLAEHSRSWKSKLSRTAGEGHVVESLGPVVLGGRLDSSLSHTAYSAVVYDKGAIVFGMLARALGGEPFNAMLRALAQQVAHRVIDTRTFLKALEHMSGMSLQGFADQFIFGTGVPEVYYRFEFAPAGAGQWAVSGEARQVSGANRRYTLVRTAAGGWDVSAQRAEHADLSDRAFVAPFQLVLETSGEPDSGKGAVRSRYQTGRGLGGNLVIQGARSEFSFTVKERPRDFFIDQGGEVLAYFYCESREPKRMLRYRALELSGDEAEALYREALRAPLLSEHALPLAQLSDRELERQTNVEDGRIHLNLARLFLDQQRDADARQALDAAERLLGREAVFHAEREILRSRLEVRSGDYKPAWNRLSRSLSLNFPRLSTNTLIDDARRLKWRTGNRRNGDGEDYALLAVTAFETANEAVARQAISEAENAGADVTALKAILD